MTPAYGRYRILVGPIAVVAADIAIALLLLRLGTAELLIYLDHGRWELVPALAVPALQWIGVGLCVFTFSRPLIAGRPSPAARRR